MPPPLRGDAMATIAAAAPPIAPRIILTSGTIEAFKQAFQDPRPSTVVQKFNDCVEAVTRGCRLTEEAVIYLWDRCDRDLRVPLCWTVVQAHAEDGLDPEWLSPLSSSNHPALTPPSFTEPLAAEEFPRAFGSEMAASKEFDDFNRILHLTTKRRLQPVGFVYLRQWCGGEMGPLLARATCLICIDGLPAAAYLP
jgi:hypothetical protein